MQSKYIFSYENPVKEFASYLSFFSRHCRRCEIEWNIRFFFSSTRLSSGHVMINLIGYNCSVCTFSYAMSCLWQIAELSLLKVIITWLELGGKRMLTLYPNELLMSWKRVLDLTSLGLAVTCRITVSVSTTCSEHM